jgi:hypothetical protein
LTASTVIYADASKILTSLANAAGVLTNNGTGTLSWGAAGGSTGKIEIGINGNGTVPMTGILTDFVVPFNLEITDWTVLADVSGSIMIDLWKDTYANYPPTIADTKTGTDKPRLSSEITKTSSALTGWTTSWTAGDVVRVNIDTVATLTRVTLVISYTRS